MDNNFQSPNENQQTTYSEQSLYGDQTQYTGQAPYGDQSQLVMQSQYGMQNPYANQPQQPGICCPRCGSNNLQVLQEQSSKGKDFSGSKGCCGAILFGPIGILCGSCGKGKQIKTQSFWLCYNCGNKFKL